MSIQGSHADLFPTNSLKKRTPTGKCCPTRTRNLLLSIEEVLRTPPTFLSFIRSLTQIIFKVNIQNSQTTFLVQSIVFTSTVFALDSWTGP